MRVNNLRGKTFGLIGFALVCVAMFLYLFVSPVAGSGSTIRTTPRRWCRIPSTSSRTPTSAGTA